MSSAHGQCIEHYGAGEAYLPLLEALGRLCREQDGDEIIAVLRQHAPSWLVQMPSLLSTAQLEELQRRTAGVTRERMLRELAEALEVITAERPLVLVLEDLHWSDVSTLDLLSMLARRQERARLLIIGTYRPVEVLTRDHPLKGIKHELQLHGQCEELALDFLTEGDVTEYLAVRFSGGAQQVVPLQSLGHLIHQRTDGNPLFMVNVTNELVAREVIIQHDGHWEIQDTLADNSIGVPENLRQLIGQQLARVNLDERRILEAASVAGTEFSAAAVAAGVQQSAETVEILCDGLVRREQFLRAQGTCEWPDGTIAARYSFVHALYQEVVYEQLSATRRSRLHRQIGERQEQAYGDRARETAAELAVHFERGRDYRRAIQYLRHAGENAVRRSAFQEAITLLSKGLELLNTLPDTPEHPQQELDLQIALGTSLIASKGYSAPEVEKTYSHALTLCRQIGESPRLFEVLSGLVAFHVIRGNLLAGRELNENLLHIAQRAQNPVLLQAAHYQLGEVLSYLGELSEAQAHLDQAIALYDPRQRRSLAIHDPGVAALVMAAAALWWRGYPDQSLKRLQESLMLAQECHQFTMALAQFGAVFIHVWRREGKTAQEQAETLIVLAQEQGFTLREATSVVLRGWTLVEQGWEEEGITQIHQGLAATQAMGAEVFRLHFLTLLAEVYGKAGRVAEGLNVVAEALAVVDKTEYRIHEAELYRIKGKLTLQNGARDWGLGTGSPSPRASSLKPLAPKEVTRKAEEYFLKAIEITRKRQAKSLELRASSSLARLWQQQGKQKEAHEMLREIYDWFTEGFDTKDLQEAKALLEELH